MKQLLLKAIFVNFLMVLCLSYNYCMEEEKIYSNSIRGSALKSAFVEGWIERALRRGVDLSTPPNYLLRSVSQRMPYSDWPSCLNDLSSQHVRVRVIVELLEYGVLRSPEEHRDQAVKEMKEILEQPEAKAGAHKLNLSKGFKLIAGQGNIEMISFILSTYGHEVDLEILESGLVRAAVAGNGDIVEKILDFIIEHYSSEHNYNVFILSLLQKALQLAAPQGRVQVVSDLLHFALRSRIRLGILPIENHILRLLDVPHMQRNPDLLLRYNAILEAFEDFTQAQRASLITPQFLNLLPCELSHAILLLFMRPIYDVSKLNVK